MAGFPCTAEFLLELEREEKAKLKLEGKLSKSKVVKKL